MSPDDGGSARRRRPGVRIPCLHNPTRHELDLHLSSGDFAWIDLEGPTDEDLQRVGELVSLHPLTLQDARTFGQRPRIEDYDDYVFMVVFGVDPGQSAGEPLLREVHLILTRGAVVTIHRHADDALAQLRARTDARQVRDHFLLLYEILDAITSTFGPVLSRIDDEIDDVEERVIDHPREESLRRIFAMKRDLVAMRRVIAPMRDMFQRRQDHFSQLPGIVDDDLIYFRDLYDGLIRTSEMIDSYRDLLSGASDLYLSTVANRQGEVNRQLTIIATIFLPLTFLTGFFGQNFALLTGSVINHAWTFWVFGLGLLAASIAGFYVWFRRRGWIGPDATGEDTSPGSAGPSPAGGTTPGA